MPWRRPIADISLEESNREFSGEARLQDPLQSGRPLPDPPPAEAQRLLDSVRDGPVRPMPDQRAQLADLALCRFQLDFESASLGDPSGPWRNNNLARRSARNPDAGLQSMGNWQL